MPGLHGHRISCMTRNEALDVGLWSRMWSVSDAVPRFLSSLFLKGSVLCVEQNGRPVQAERIQSKAQEDVGGPQADVVTTVRTRWDMLGLLGLRVPRSIDRASVEVSVCVERRSLKYWASSSIRERSQVRVGLRSVPASMCQRCAREEAESG